MVDEADGDLIGDGVNIAAPWMTLGMVKQTPGSWHRIAAARQRLVLCRLMINIMRDLHGTYAPASEPFGNRLETFFIGLCVALAPKGKAIVNINKGEAFYGEVDILGKLYETGYDPIKDASGKLIGIWYVGYAK